MGLDMTLYKQTKKADKRFKCGYRTINQDLACWRYANAIHGWFIHHDVIKYGDNLIPGEVTHEHIGELIDDCNTVINKYNEVKERLGNVPQITRENAGDFFDLAEEILPTERGFFFGSYDYDEYYISLLKDTVDQLTTVLETTTDDDTILYEAWW